MKIYAHPASQPSRAVIWACVMQALPIELIPNTTPVSSINPRGQLPCIDDDGFRLTEMPAILMYLAGKYGWTDLYPTDLRRRARIDQYLHAHHNLTRLATTQLMAPHVLRAFAQPPLDNPLSFISNLCIGAAMESPSGLKDGQAQLTHVVGYIERHYLNDGDFIASNDHPTIADLACYEELGQLVSAELFDFSVHPQVVDWMQRMAKLPGHEVVHRYNQKLGDIRTTANNMARFSAAIQVALDSLAEVPTVTLS
ncbi:MAG: glutathione S-transferase family protein [Pseudomonadales bacterium]